MIVTRGMLADDLRRLGVRPGAVVIAHARMSALGAVAGGAQSLVEALLDAVGPDGTIVAYTGWEDEPGDLHALDEADRARVLAEHPVFDAARARARREHGRLAEAIRTWPGAERSRHPEAGVAAIGARAAWVCADHPWDDAYGAGTPYARIVAADGQVASLGAPAEATTLVHHAESIARPGVAARRVSHAYPLLIDGRRTWRTVHDVDTGTGAYGYAAVLGDADHVAFLADGALAAGHGREGPLGGGTGRVLEARGLVAHAVAWIEAAFPAP